MKTRLLKKVRKRVKIYERNGMYYVDTGNYVYSDCRKDVVLDHYIDSVISIAKDIFGFRPKKTIK